MSVHSCSHVWSKLLIPITIITNDIDSEVFEQLADRMNDNATRVMFYASSNDKALKVSKKIHGFLRAGESGQNIVILPGELIPWTCPWRISNSTGTAIEGSIELSFPIQV